MKGVRKTGTVICFLTFKNSRDRALANFARAAREDPEYADLILGLGARLLEPAPTGLRNTHGSGEHDTLSGRR